MSRSFLKGLWLGLLGSAVLLGGFVYWIYRYTRKVPFPVQRPAEGEVILRLVAPDEVPAYWAEWRRGLEPLWRALSGLWAEAQRQLAGMSGTRRGA